MDEAEQLADRIVILVAGQIVASGTPATIGGRETEASLIEFSLPEGMTAESLPSLPVPLRLPGPGRAEISAPEPMPVLHELSGWAMKHDLPLTDIAIRRPSLEDIYLRLTRENS